MARKYQEGSPYPAARVMDAVSHLGPLGAAIDSVSPGSPLKNGTPGPSVLGDVVNRVRAAVPPGGIGEESATGIDPNTARGRIQARPVAPAIQGAQPQIQGPRPQVQPPAPTPTETPSPLQPGNVEQLAEQGPPPGQEGAYDYSGPPPTGNKTYGELTGQERNQVSALMSDPFLAEAFPDWQRQLENGTLLDSIDAQIQNIDRLQGLGPAAFGKLGQELRTKLEGVRGQLATLLGRSPIQWQRQLLLNDAAKQLAATSSYGSREDEEQLLAGLASRGLLDSGIAAREIARYREAKFQNFQTAMSQLIQSMYQSGINQLNAIDLANVSADLQKRNQEALARINGEYAIEASKAGQPSPWAQVGGTAIGIAGALAAPPAPGRGGGSPFTQAPDPYVNA